MAGLVPGHPRLAFLQHRKDVDARHKAGHDGEHVRLLKKWLDINIANQGEDPSDSFASVNSFAMRSPTCSRAARYMIR
jgi:hypothetical protein